MNRYVPGTRLTKIVAAGDEYLKVHFTLNCVFTYIKFFHHKNFKDTTFVTSLKNIPFSYSIIKLLILKLNVLEYIYFTALMNCSIRLLIS